MLISYDWLKDFVDVELTAVELRERLTMVGLAIDAVEEHGDDAVLDVEVPSNRPDCLSHVCLLYTSPSPRDGLLSRMPSSA